jgi:hypothetical protein
MLKFFALFIIIVGVIGGGIYYLFFTETKAAVEVTGKIQFTAQIGSGKTTAQNGTSVYYAVVKGRVKNNLKKPLTNIFIRYKIAGQQSSATIFDLAPGQQSEFNTRMVEITVTNPEYFFESIQYDEKSL